MRIGSVLEKNLKQLGISNRINEKRAVQIWFDEVGPEIARATRALDSRDGILFVAVKTSTWAQQLALLKGELLVKLNRRLGRRVIKDIKFRVGSWPAESSLDGGGQGAFQVPRGCAEPGRLRSEEMSELARELDKSFGHIFDDKLKEAFIKAVVACKMARERRK
ncbi:MAG TPA: DUF721 domain-containing protein [Firmicutes bacterium]|nr:DUF721 domain-containing protein [Bacillota bacterium]